MLTLRDVLAMSSPLRVATIAAVSSILFVQLSHQQTFTSCNPTQQQCPPDPALGRSVSIDFTKGPSDEFTTQGNPTYGSDGASFTISGSGDAPAIISNWYIMFGKYEIVMKAAPGAGIVSSSVLQSNDLDEIDWEWLGAQNDEVQTNYFGKGQTTSYDRAAVHAVSDTQGDFHTYTTEWTENQIVWQIDGTTVRVLSADDANGQFPQTPSQLRIGAWSGGDPSNPQGTIDWSQGPTNYGDGPFSMVVSSVSVTDYSTGSEYVYYDQSGDWTSIGSKGGKVNGNAGGATLDTHAPQITSTGNSNIIPWQGTHAESYSMTTTYTSYPGLPSGWTVNPTSGKVSPPSAAPSTSPSALSTPAPSDLGAAYCSQSGYSVVTSYDEQGFLTTATVPAGISTRFDQRGFVVTVYPRNCQTRNLPVQVGNVLVTATGTQNGDGGDGGEVTAGTTAPLPTDLGAFKGSEASHVAVAWSAALCTLLAVVVVAAAMLV